jgi:hypothetical protein
MSNNPAIVRRTFLGMSGFAAQTSNASNASGVKVEKDVVADAAGHSGQ